MPSTVSSYQQGAFVTPVNGGAGDASVVLGNDNALRLKFNSHDADAAIHVQSSVLASRPVAGTAGRFWISSDGLRGYLDAGASWGELAYLPLVGGTLTGGVTIASGAAWTTSTWAKTLALLNGGAIEFGSTNAGGTNSWLVGSTIIGTPNLYFGYTPQRDASGIVTYPLVLSAASGVTVSALTATGTVTATGAVQKAAGVTGSLASGTGFSIVTAASLVVDGVYLVTTSKVGSPAAKAVGLYVVGSGTTSAVTVTGTSGTLTLITNNGDLEGQQTTGSAGTYQWSILRLL